MARLTVLSYGGGQDSDTLLKKYIYDKKFRAQYAPDDFLVLMSDTGDEHASTYKHVLKTEQLCRKHGIKFHLITEDEGYHGSWGNLRSFYLRTKTIGSKAFPKTCTDKLKLVPFYNWLEDYIKKNYYFGPNLSNASKRVYHEFTSNWGQIDILLGIAKGEEKRLPDPAKNRLLLTKCIL